MPASPYLSVVVPAFNEVHSIERTINSIRSHLQARGKSYEVIVAADGDDGTREVVAEMGRTDPRIVVIGSAERGGKGRGVRNGIFKASGQYVGFCDADYKTPIEEIEKLLPWLEQGYEVAIGSRRVENASIEVPQPLYRRLGSQAFSFVRNVLVGLGDIRDTQCGFKFFQRGAAKAIFSRQRIDGYMFDVEILYLARLLGYRVREVGVRWQDDGDSRSNLALGTWRHARDLLKIRFTDYSRGGATLDSVLPGGATTAAAPPGGVGRAC
jgi:dolichyl-phosphate beta-glucosyltransferase